MAFDPRLPETRRVLSDCTISYNGAYYSVPYLLVGKRLTVKADLRKAEIEIFDGARNVASHGLVEKGQRVMIEEHIAELRKPRWDRVRGRQAKAGSPVAPSRPKTQLVAWPDVPVATREIGDYLNLIEEVAR